VKGNNTYQIVYTDNSDMAMDGAEVGSDSRINLFKICLPYVY